MAKAAMKVFINKVDNQLLFGCKVSGYPENSNL